MSNPHMKFMGRLEAVDIISMTVVSAIANIKDFSTRSRLAADWGRMAFEILESMNVTLDQDMTREEAIIMNQKAAQTWCEEARTEILNQRRKDLGGTDAQIH